MSNLAAEAQLVARRNCDPKEEGSIPSGGLFEETA